MSDEAASAHQPAKLHVLSQYVRSVAFENEAAKRNQNPSGAPNITVQVNVTNSDIGSSRYIVILSTNVAATMKDGDDDVQVFSVTLDYAGVFELSNVPVEALNQVLSIECPRLLFPFARRIIAEVTRDGGFPPLMLDPIDFASLYRRQLDAEGANGGAA